MQNKRSKTPEARQNKSKQMHIEYHYIVPSRNGMAILYWYCNINSWDSLSNLSKLSWAAIGVAQMAVTAPRAANVRQV